MRLDCEYFRIFWYSIGPFCSFHLSALKKEFLIITLESPNKSNPINHFKRNKQHELLRNFIKTMVLTVFSVPRVDGSEVMVLFHALLRFSIHWNIQG